MSGQRVMNKWCVAFGLVVCGLLVACGTPSDSGRGSHSEEEIVGIEQNFTTPVMCGDDLPGDWCSSQRNVIGGKPNTLYHCTPRKEATNPRFCAAGCVEQPPGTDDTCAPHPYIVNATVLNVAQNGNFDGGNAGRLLWLDDLARGKLGGNQLPMDVAVSRLSWTLANGISLTDPTSTGVRCRDGAAGDWCGSESNVLGGQANVLYHCTKNFPATNARVCAASCVENPGRADNCAPVTELITKSAGQCAEFAQKASGAPLTRYWRRGDRAIDRCPAPGTVIATFEDSGIGTGIDRYRYQGHTAIVVGCTATSLDVFDANWIDSTTSYLLHVGRHTFTTSQTGLSNAGNYYVVMAP